MISENGNIEGIVEKIREPLDIMTETISVRMMMRFVIEFFSSFLINSVTVCAFLISVSKEKTEMFFRIDMVPEEDE